MFKKMLNMLILEILKEYSDEDHKLTQQEIIRLLKLNYGMECDRRSVKNNISYLKELGYEISTEGGTYLISREFEDAELRLLIDSVLFSKNMTQKQAKGLIDKLRGLGNRYFSAKVSHIVNLPDLQHSDNKQLLYTLDAVNDAIASKKKISFMYNEYGVDFKLHPKREDPYIVNPYQLVANNGKYYLIGNIDKYNNAAHFRLDKMTCVKILDEKCKPAKEVKDFENGFNLPKHMAEHIYMFGGKSINVKIKTTDDMMSELVDWFGRDFDIISHNNGEVIAVLKCNMSAIRYWALQYGPYVEILSPIELRKQILQDTKEMLKKYKSNT